MHSDAELSPPASVDEIRGRVSFQRWRLYEAARQILAEVESHVDWERLYDVDAELAELLSWGLYLEETLPTVAKRIRDAFSQAELSAAPPEPKREELEDHVWWGTRQIEGGVRQSLAVLSREMVNRITAGSRPQPGDGEVEIKRALAMPIAEVAGKLRSDLRKLTSFLVAEGLWNPDAIELVLFPKKREELEKSRSLKQRLVETMEGFQGSGDRLPISQVIRLWRNGQALGQAALAEIDALIRGLTSMLDRDNRKALYVDSYYRLRDWIEHLERCSRGLQERLGDEAVEDELTKQIAAVLDADILAEILGEETLHESGSPEAMAEILESITPGELKRLELKKLDEQRILDLTDEIEAARSSGQQITPADDDERLLRSAAARIRGRRMVDALRLPDALPASLAHLEPLHALVLAAEDGLRTYLTILYGQIQNRDLHLLEEDHRDVPLAEKRLAVSELEYHLARLDAAEGYWAFEAVRHRLAEEQTVPVEEWEGLCRFLEHLRQIVAPRLARLASFEEVSGVPDEGAKEMTTACMELMSLEEPPSANQLAAVREWVEWLAALLVDLQHIRIVMAPPQTEAEIEDFLNMMG